MRARISEASTAGRTKATWKEVSVFVCSTFTDMQAERDHLMKVVFPALRERLLRYRVHLREIDLRWGIPRNQIEHAGSLEPCLQHIERCAPFFICLLGERYGWVPSALPANTVAKYPWIEQYPGRSITELEVRYAVLDARICEHSLFFFRDPQALGDVPDGVARADYLETGLDAQQQLAALKRRILDSGHPVVSYGAHWSADRRGPDGRAKLVGLDDFGCAVERELWNAFSGHLGLGEATNEAHSFDVAADEEEQHQQFMQSRLQVYVGRAEAEAAVVSALKPRDGRWVVVSGAPGVGKSAVLTSLYQKLAGEFELAVPHFSGATHSSTSVVPSLRRFCDLLLRASGVDDPVPASPDDLISYFPRCLERLSRDRTILLVVDGVEHWGDTSVAPLAWLPPVLPTNVAVVLSCTGGTSLDKAVRAGARIVELGELAPEHRREIVERVPSLFGRTLDEELKSELLSNPAAGNPLFLLVALEELRGVGTVRALHDRIQRLPRGDDAVAELFKQVVERLLVDFDGRLCATVLRNLACSRNGLSERELRTLAARDFAEHDDFSPLLRQLRGYLMMRGELLTFAHEQLRLAINHALLADPAARDATHDGLVRYFLRRADPTGSRDWEADQPRSLEELAFHLRMARRSQELVELLTDPGFLDAFASRVHAVDRWGRRYHEGVYALLAVLRGTIDSEDARRADERALPERAGERRQPSAPTNLTSLVLSKGGRAERGRADLERVAARFLTDVRDLGTLCDFVRDELDFVVDHKQAFRAAVSEGFDLRFAAHDGRPRPRSSEPRIFLQDQRDAAFVKLATDILEVVRTSREKPDFYGFPCWTSVAAAGLVHDIARWMFRRRTFMWQGIDDPLTPLQIAVLKDALAESESPSE